MIVASVATDTLQVLPTNSTTGRGSRARCRCCGSRAAFELFANGVCMGFAGCELYVWRWKRKFEAERGFK